MRRSASLLIAAVVAGTVLLGPTRPAAAIVVCGGTGTMHVNPGLLYPVLLGVGSTWSKDHFVDLLIGSQVQVAHSFTFGLAPGACVHVRTLVPPITLNAVASGTLKGYCGHSSGWGTFQGQPFAFVSAGTLLVMTGHVVGVASAVPVPVLTRSCLHAEGPVPTTTYDLPGGGATDFLVQGAAVGLDCFTSLSASETLLRLTDFSGSVTPTVGLHVTTGVHLYTMRQCP